MVRSLVLSAVCLLSFACGGAEPEALADSSAIESAEQAVRAAPVAAYELNVTASRERKAKFGQSFVIDDLDALHFAIDVPDVAGRHVAQLFVYGDGGVPYASYDVAYAVREPAQDGELVAVRGDKAEMRVWVSMPVAGTWIQQYRLAGAWRAEVFIDNGVVGPIATGFTLQ